MNDRPMPPHTPSARPPFSLIVGGKTADSESPRIWKSCLARLVINASFMEPIFVNAKTDKDQDPIHHYTPNEHELEAREATTEIRAWMRSIGPLNSLR